MVFVSACSLVRSCTRLLVLSVGFEGAWLRSYDVLAADDVWVESGWR